MNLDDLTRKLTSGEIPAGAMAAGAILALLVAFKLAKGFAKSLSILAALALLAGAAWWHFQHKN